MLLYTEAVPVVKSSIYFMLIATNALGLGTCTTHTHTHTHTHIQTNKQTNLEKLDYDMI